MTELRFDYYINTLSGVEVKVYEDFDTVEGNYIPLTTIDRDGIPEIGEPVFKEFYY